MQQQTSSTETLAHWRYEPDLWRDFVEYESRVYRKSIRSAKHFIIGTLIGAAVLLALLSAIALVIKKFDPSIWGPAFGICIVAGTFLAVGFIMLALRKQKMARLNTPTGEAIITTNKILLNATGMEWNYGGPGWQFVDAELKSVQVTPLKKIQIVEFKFVNFISSKNTPQREEAEFRVPVQMGKETEADKLIERLRSETSPAGQG